MGPGPLLPPPMVLYAAAVAFVVLLPRVRRPLPLPRLLAEAFLTALVAIAAVQALWFGYWLIEQRW